MDTGSKTNRNIFSYGKNVRVLDEAWDVFMDYMGENGISNPLTTKQFEEILSIVDRDKRFVKFKEQILHSFQYDTGAWPLVKRERGE